MTNYVPVLSLTATSTSLLLEHKNLKFWLAEVSDKVDKMFEETILRRIGFHGWFTAIFNIF